MRTICFVWLAMAALAPGLSAGASADLRDVVGVSHVAGRYNFSGQDFLNEGADRILELGSRVIKVWFTADPQRAYPFNSQWAKPASLVDEARTPYFRALFSKPFSTFILVAYPPGKEWSEFAKGMTPADVAEVRRQMDELSRYLLTEYRGTGKTFVLQNWESDWALTDPKFAKDPDPTAIRAMIDWLNARQDGVNQARREIGTHGVTVVHAAEVNLVARAMEGRKTATNDVLPRTHCDLYSYSAWDTETDPAGFRKALAYLASKAPDSKLYGSRNIYVGEFGACENGVGGGKQQLRIVQPALETALKWGARYVVYWQLYCDGTLRKTDGRPTNDDCSGLWLIRPDGTKSPTCYYLSRLLKPVP